MDTEELKAIEILSSAQQQYVMRLMAELKDSNQTTIHIVDSIEEQGRDELVSCQDIEDKLALRSHRVNTNHIVKTSQDEILIVYHPNHHEEDLVKIIADAMRSFSTSKKLKVPSGDIRHSHLNIEELDRLYGEGRYGTIHCACWFEQGKPQDGPMLSREMLMNCRTFNACTKLIADMQPLKDHLSLLYAAASPISWRKCVDRFAKLRKYLPSARVLTLSDIDPWSSLALVANIPSHIHRDFGDARHHLSGLACSGDFSKGWMIIYALRMRFRYKPVDGLLFNTYLLPHFVKEWNPEHVQVQRFSLSFFNHQEILNWIKEEHVRRNMYTTTQQ